MRVPSSFSVAGMKIAVLVGGPGSEREVSLHSGEAVAEALRSLGAAITTVDVKGAEFSLPRDTTIAVNMIHGTFGEDGQIQAILDERGIPYTGEGVVGSQLAFDKIKSKRRFEEAGIPTPEWHVLHHGETPRFAKPYVLKPPREGSSVGVHIIHDHDSTFEALLDCLRYDQEILAERFICGRELTVGIVGNQVLPTIQIVPVDEFYTYHSKYAMGGSKHICPAPLRETVTDMVQRIALAAHNALGLEVYSRVDLLLDENDQPFVLEINTIPGMTQTSLLPDAAAVAGIPFPQLCASIVALSLQKYASSEAATRQQHLAVGAAAQGKDLTVF